MTYLPMWYKLPLWWAKSSSFEALLSSRHHRLPPPPFYDTNPHTHISLSLSLSLHPVVLTVTCSPVYLNVRVINDRSIAPTWFVNKVTFERPQLWIYYVWYNVITSNSGLVEVCKLPNMCSKCKEHWAELLTVQGGWARIDGGPALHLHRDSCLRPPSPYLSRLKPSHCILHRGIFGRLKFNLICRVNWKVCPFDIFFCDLDR